MFSFDAFSQTAFSEISGIARLQAVNLADYTETGAGVTANTLQAVVLNDNRTAALTSYNEIFVEVLSVPTSVKRS